MVGFPNNYWCSYLKSSFCGGDSGYHHWRKHPYCLLVGVCVCVFVCLFASLVGLFDKQFPRIWVFHSGRNNSKMSSSQMKSLVADVWHHDTPTQTQTPHNKRKPRVEFGKRSLLQVYIGNIAVLVSHGQYLILPTHASCLPKRCRWAA